jgi:hypothetical protein
MRSSQLVKPELGVFVSLLFPISAMAGTSGYGVEELIVNIFLYVLGLIAISIFGGITKDKGIKIFWTLVFAAYVIVPSIYIFKLMSERESSQIQPRKQQEQMAWNEFESLCKKYPLVVHGRAQRNAEKYLIVLFDKAFTGGASRFNADQLASQIKSDTDFCLKSELTAIEGIYTGEYDKKVGYPKEVRRYPVCTNTQAISAPDGGPRFELVIGQTRRGGSIAWGAGDGTMLTSSIKLTDKLTGQLMAEDSMSVFRNKAGEFGCQDGVKQITNLLGEVFARQ